MANSISHASIPYPIKNARFTVLTPFLDADGDPTDPTTPDSEVSQDGGAFADAAEEVTTISGSNGVGYLTLTGAETNNSAVAVALKVASGPKATLMTLYPKNLAIVGSGTLSAGSAGGGTLGTLLAYDVCGCFIRTTGGTGGGGTGGANNQARRIITYNTSTGAFTVSPNWETTPSTDTTYDVLLPEGLTLGALRALNPATAGRTAAIDASGQVTVGTIANNAITAASIASDAITNAKVADGVLTAAKLATDTITAAKIASDAITAAKIATGAITSAKFAAGAIDAAAIAADAIGASELAADAITEIQSGLATSANQTTINTKLDTIDDFLDTEIAAIKAKTDNLPSDPADASDVAGSFSTVNTTLATIAGYLDTEIAAIKAKTDNLPAAPAATGDIPSAATIAVAVRDVSNASPAANSLGNDARNAAIDASTAASAATDASNSAGAANTAASAVKVVTDKLATAIVLDGAVYQFTANALELAPSGGGGSAPTAAEIADAVWDEVQSGHTTAGTFGKYVDGQISSIVSGSAIDNDVEITETEVEDS